jgi:hypothetical protein
LGLWRRRDGFGRSCNRDAFLNYFGLGFRRRCRLGGRLWSFDLDEVRHRDGLLDERRFDHDRRNC